MARSSATTPLLTFLASAFFFTHTASAAYTLADSYTAANWFEKFVFFDQKDPTNGFVQYKNLKSAAQSGLIAIDGAGDNAAVYMGVDHTTKDPAGRASIRISSKKSYNHGLFIFDIEHNPGSICGTWPAAWLLSDSGKWPVGGEIDIFEGANDQADNKMTLHTTSGCQIKPTGFSGKIDTPNCDVNAQGQGKNMGCGILHPMTQGQSFGRGMNAVGGGVYATMWTSQDISIYHFPRSLVPADISAGKPNPATWGMPVAKFAGGCNIDEHFQNLNIIFNTAFCGDWAGEAWNSSTTCQAKAPTCQAYVQNNPEAFKDAYWMIRSVKVYQEGKATTRRSRIAHDTTMPDEPQQIHGNVEDVDDVAPIVRRRWFTEGWDGLKKGLRCAFGSKENCE
ncbi:MAG: hypothetical protein L6R39_005399 [Caloplaca ligustica]|nr:MAG: hypothetical protein L6R39_005399 [Caloplaca ligustica]